MIFVDENGVGVEMIRAVAILLQLTDASTTDDGQQALHLIVIQGVGQPMIESGAGSATSDGIRGIAKNVVVETTSEEIDGDLVSHHCGDLFLWTLIVSSSPHTFQPVSKPQ